MRVNNLSSLTKNFRVKDISEKGFVNIKTNYSLTMRNRTSAREIFHWTRTPARCP